MTIPLDTTNINSFFDWIFHTGDVTLFGSVGMMMVALIVLGFGLLMIMNANKFTAVGFISSLLLAFGYFGYSIVGWVAPFGALLAGLLMGIALITIFKQ